MSRPSTSAQYSRFTPAALAVRDQISGRSIDAVAWGELSIDARCGRDALWFVIRRAGKGGLALRATPPSAGPISATRREGADHAWRLQMLEGRAEVRLQILSPRLMRLTSTLTPARDLLIPFWPRDLYPIDNSGDPLRTEGRVEAAQRGLNAAVCYFHLDKPSFGSALYFQNLTALNPYFEATQSKPQAVVGGEWPELGYQAGAGNENATPKAPLRTGEPMVVSDLFLSIGPPCSDGELVSAATFIDAMAEIYPHLDQPPVRIRDWPARATKTMRDLQQARDVTEHHYGQLYVRPYVGAEHPDAMAQMAVAAPLFALGRARGQDYPLAEALLKGMPRFYDERGFVRRYLADVGDDKNENAVDSWYLYHPLLHLGRLAAAGHQIARTLFENSLAYAVKAARHFGYTWPIEFDSRNFSVLQPARNEQGLGQTDVGGLYAYVMVQAYELTRDETYLAEARAALRALRQMRFSLAYQTNLTAWGAVACLKLYRRLHEDEILAQAEVFIAGFLHNCHWWESEIGHARAYTTFLGASCLHDSPYMAAFECFESFHAFDEYLQTGGGDVRPQTRLLVSEYCRHALNRAWFFYPDALPEDAIAKEDIRNGRIERSLALPLEDVYTDGEPAGKVGQEVYGCGGAFTFVARAFHECGDAPFRVFFDRTALVACAPGELSAQLCGPAGAEARIRVLRKGARAVPRLTGKLADGARWQVAGHGDGFRDYRVPADALLTIAWR